MIAPDVWGQGQLFAFSALDGTSLVSDDFVGILCGDKIGVRFFTKVKRELVITNVIRSNCPEFKAVASDIITLNTKNGDINIIYVDTHLIIGNIACDAVPVVMTEGIHQALKIGDIEIQNSLDGDFTAILRKADKFAFAYGHSEKEVCDLVSKGVDLSIENIKEQKLNIYNKFKLGDDNKFSKLYAKCISVMKSQLYSPEGNFQRIWSTPDRLPHTHLWLWDSVFHSVGYRNIDTKLAEDLILDIFDNQAEDGFIPHMATVESISDVIQPPVISWGSWLVYEKSGNKAFLKEVFEHNKNFLLWCRANRREGNNELYTWFTEDYALCRCGESGMDNSPRFDLDTRLEAIDFSCYMANEARCMAKIASELGDIEEEKYFSDWYEKIKYAINNKLWCEEEGFYYDYDLLNNRLHKIQTVASFLPLLAGICSKKQAKALVKHLENPNEFNTPLPIPCVSKQDSTYGTDMWRGPVWLNYNYMVIEGLKNCGFTELADEITNKTIDSLDFWYNIKGTLFEFYDPENISSPDILDRKGSPLEPYDFYIRMQSIRDYGWTATLPLDLLHNKYLK